MSARFVVQRRSRRPVPSSIARMGTKLRKGTRDHGKAQYRSPYGNTAPDLTLRIYAEGRQLKECPMRTTVFGGLLLAAGLAIAAPAHAQGVWFGAGPVGVGVGVGSYAYDYAPGPYWGAAAYPAPTYNPYFVYGSPAAYSNGPGWSYAAPVYEASYAYLPGYSYAPEYTYRTSYAVAPATTYSRSFAYVPQRAYSRTVYRSSHRTRVVMLRSRYRHVRSEALAAEASVPVHHVRHRVPIRRHID
jgi:hypothetical protein